MKREEKIINKNIPMDISFVKYNNDRKDELKEYLIDSLENERARYFTNSTIEGIISDIDSDEYLEHSYIAINQSNEIVGSSLVYLEDEKLWIDYFTMIPQYDGCNFSTFLLQETMKSIDCDIDDSEIMIYLNRNCKEAIRACENNGMVAFEFWVDLVFNK